MRLLVGVGFLGALTSYAELALDIIQLGESRHWILAGRSLFRRHPADEVDA